MTRKTRRVAVPAETLNRKLGSVAATAGCSHVVCHKPKAENDCLCFYVDCHYRNLLYSKHCCISICGCISEISERKRYLKKVTEINSFFVSLYIQNSIFIKYKGKLGWLTFIQDTKSSVYNLKQALVTCTI